MTTKITSIRILAIELSKRPVYMFEIGKNLNKKVELWLKRKEIIMATGNGISFIQLNESI